MNRILAKTNVYTQRTLTNVQFGAVLMTALLGVGVLNLPRTMTVNMNTADGWISVIIAGVAVSLIFCLMSLPSSLITLIRLTSIWRERSASG